MGGTDASWRPCTFEATRSYRGSRHRHEAAGSHFRVLELLSRGRGCDLPPAAKRLRRRPASGPSPVGLARAGFEYGRWSSSSGLARELAAPLPTRWRRAIRRSLYAGRHQCEDRAKQGQGLCTGVRVASPPSPQFQEDTLQQRSAPEPTILPGIQRGRQGKKIPSEPPSRSELKPFIHPQRRCYSIQETFNFF
jgi:hypothetical protein